MTLTGSRLTPPPKSVRNVQVNVLRARDPMDSLPAPAGSPRLKNLQARASDLTFLRRAEWTSSTVLYAAVACIAGYVAGSIT